MNALAACINMPLCGGRKRASGPLGLEFWTVVHRHVGAGSRTLVLSKNASALSGLSHLFSPFA